MKQVLIQGWGILTEMKAKAVIEEQLFDLCVLAKEGKYREIWDRLYKKGLYEQFLSSMLAFQGDKDFVCEHHGQHFVPFNDRTPYCDECERLELERSWTPTEAA